MRTLEGLRVLDLSRLLPGPFATMLLADLGAQVDKVEDPHGGDYLRNMPPQRDGMNAAFHTLNRGKRSLVLDLKTDAGRAALLRLIPRYDVLVESFRPGVLARLGLGYESLSQANPRLVYCALSGYGQDGPDAQRAGHDLNFVSRAGVLGMTGPVNAPPQVPGVQVADVGGALFAVTGILAALVGREKSGRGAFVDISLCESAMSFGVLGLLSELGGLSMARGDSPLTGGIAPYGTYATKDGGAIAVAALEPKFWMTFCAAVGLPASMEALAPGPHQVELRAQVAQIAASKTRAEWSEFSRTYDCCLSVVLDPNELASDAQHGARGAFAMNEGRVQFAHPLARHVVDRAAPMQGQHSRDVLRDAGFSDDEVSSLVK